MDKLGFFVGFVFARSKEFAFESENNIKGRGDSQNYLKGN